MEGWAGMREAEWLTDRSSGRRAEPGEGLLGTVFCLSLVAEVSVGATTMLLRGAGEKPFLVVSPYSLLQFSLYYTFQVEFMAKSTETSLVSLTFLTLLSPPSS